MKKVVSRPSSSKASRIAPPAPLPSPNTFTGQWRYRSFLNEPKHVDKIDDILFAEGVLTFAETLGVLTGTGDFGPGYTVDFQGVTSYGGSPTVRFLCRGTGPTNQDWHYDYVGTIAPTWPNGVGQIPAIIGTLVRSAPHKSSDGSMEPAGVTASFIAVKIS